MLLDKKQISFSKKVYICSLEFHVNREGILL